MKKTIEKQEEGERVRVLRSKAIPTKEELKKRLKKKKAYVIGITQGELADRMDYSRQQVSDVENNTKRMTVKFIEALEKALKITKIDIFKK